MASLINPCDITESSVANTGIECDGVLGIAAGVLIAHPSQKYTAEDLADPLAFFEEKIHAAGKARMYPIMQGIFDFGVAKDSDVTEANPIAGISKVIRLGGLNLTYTFDKGGECLANSILEFFGKGWGFIPVDNEGQFKLRKNADGTYSPLRSYEVSPNFAPKTASTSYKNIVVFSCDYNEWIKAKLFKSDTTIDLNGLIDAEIVSGGAATTTKLKIGVQTECAETDLVAEYDTDLADLDLFIVTDKNTSTVITPSAIAVAAGVLEITGTYTTGHVINVTGSAPSVWLTNEIPGYDATNGLDITIP